MRQVWVAALFFLSLFSQSLDCGNYFTPSLLPRSASSSVKYSPASVRSAVDLRTLRPFEDQAAISLGSWPEYPGGCGNQPTRPNGPRILRVLGA
jgi:hypothetical protein